MCLRLIAALPIFRRQNWSHEYILLYINLRYSLFFCSSPCVSRCMSCYLTCEPQSLYQLVWHFVVTVSLTWRHARGLVAQQPTANKKYNNNKENTNVPPKPALHSAVSRSSLLCSLWLAQRKDPLLSASSHYMEATAIRVLSMPFLYFNYK